MGETIVRRALLVHHNKGWSGEKALKYTKQDVMSLSRVLNHKGNFHTQQLSNPTSTQLRQKIRSIHRRIQRDTRRGFRTHFLFYYSGHADREYLHLGPQSQQRGHQFSLKSLAMMLKKLPTSIKIIILDTCYAGALIEMMGGNTKGRRPHRARYFSMQQDSQKVTAILASSISQSIELKALRRGQLIKKSIFTHYLVEALGGKADQKRHGFGNGDGHVSISEAFAYTRHNTIKAAKGLQDPTRYLEIKGRNAYPLTTSHHTPVQLQAKRGDIFIFSGAKHGVLMRLKANKTGHQTISMLADRYHITLRTQNNQCYQQRLSLNTNTHPRKIERTHFQKKSCPETSFWQQKGPQRVGQSLSSPLPTSKRELPFNLSLLGTGGDIVQSVVPASIGGSIMFGIELGWSAAHLMLSFQTGARETVLSYYPELAASWGWSPTVGSFTLFAGPLVGVGMLVIDQVAQAQQSAGANIRYGGLLQVGWCFHKRFSLVLGGFLGASSTQQRTDEGVGWKTSFSFRGTFGLRWYL